MDEAASSEVEKVLLFISDARDRTARALKKLNADEADEATLRALAQAERDLSRIHRELMQGAYFTVPAASEQLVL